MTYLFPFPLKFVFEEQSHRTGFGAMTSPGRRQVLEGHVMLAFSFMEFLSLKFKCEIISKTSFQAKESDESKYFNLNVQYFLPRESSRVLTTHL